MTTTQQPATSRTALEVIANLRAKIPTSKQLAEDVNEALDELEAYLKGSDDVSDRADKHLGTLEVIETIVAETPDASLRERLLDLRQTIEANPEITLEQLRFRY